MKNQCVGLINLDDRKNSNINQLTYTRPIASTPIGARYRIIDFVLSNMVNSGLTNVGIFAKEKYRSLTDHVGSGKDWDLSRKKGGLFVFSPENTKNKNTYSNKKGDIYNILANIDYIEMCEEEYILIAPTYMVCNIDYSKALKYHKKSGNDITVIYKNVENAQEDFEGNSTLDIDENNKIINVGSNIGVYSNANISMETYIMKRTEFIEHIYSLVSKGSCSYLQDFISEAVKYLNVGAYEYTGYLKCVNSVKAYFEINKELLTSEVSNELLYSKRRIFTREKNQSPTIYTESAKVENSFVATGCVIEGTVKNSILFRKVHVKEGAIIENCVVMQNCTIDKDVKLNNVIFDKNVCIKEGKELKGDEDYPIVIEKNASI
ncbi:glucose-1-phosphate adenylyltransferase subunit GlgD [Romboutsia sp.]|uniref:glucose-1-phosphate adenylyltransferase subunit GlgD n=1 Tax=Romboutsia sp. TaxID=1965302 RepID=UPI003F2A6222